MASSNAGDGTAKSKKQTTLIDIIKPFNIRETYDLKPHPVTGRLIDSHPGTRTKPMRVLCLGMSRTGTMTLFTALQRLGFKPYHMALALGSPKSNLDLWCEGLNAKYHGQGQSWGKAEFDKILGDYDAVADVPAICFVEELVAAYPDALVVLTSRNVDTWLTSMANTAGYVLSWNWAWLAQWDHALAQPFWEHAKLVVPIQFSVSAQSPDFVSPDTKARQAFARHYEIVRRVVPKDRLLEYKVQEGWQPLCKALGVDVPDEDFPRVNDANQFIFAHRMMWWIGIGKMVGWLALLASPVLVAGAAAVWWRS